MKHFIWTEDSIKKFWDLRTQINPDYYFSKKFGKDIIRSVKNKVNLNSDILDFGSGPGHLTQLLLANKKSFVAACDISPKNVESLNKNFSQLSNFKGGFLVEDNLFHKYANSFDVIFLIECIEHLLPDQIDQYCTNLLGLLRKGGVLVITTPNQENFLKQMSICPNCHTYFHRIQHLNQWSTQTLSSRMEALGFKTEYCYTTAFTGYFYLNYLYGLAHKFYYGYKPNLVYIGKK